MLPQPPRGSSGPAASLPAPGPHRPRPVPTRPSRATAPGLSSPSGPRGPAVRGRCPLSAPRGLNSRRPAAGKEREQRRPAPRSPGRSGHLSAAAPGSPAPPRPGPARRARSAALTDLPPEVLQHPHLVAAVPSRHRASAAACAVQRAAGGREGGARPGPATRPPAADTAPPPPAAALGGHQRPERGGGRPGACAMAAVSRQGPAVPP